MKKILLGLSLLSTMSFARTDETELARKGSAASTFQYGASVEEYTNAAGDSVTEKWVSIHSGHLTVGVDRELQGYRMRVNANGGELLGLQNTAFGKKTLNRLQIEASMSSTHVPYGLLAVELPVWDHTNMFLGSVHNPGGNQRLIMGPIAYWGKNNYSSVFYYTKGVETETVTNHVFVARNHVEALPAGFWLNLDGSYKIVKEAEEVEDFDPYGYSASLGIWKVYGKYAVTPYYEGQKVKKTAYEVGIDASF